MPKKNKSPETGILTYGPKSLVNDIRDLAVPRYRALALSRMFLMITIASLLIGVVNITYPQLASLLDTWLHEEFAVLSLEWIINPIAWGLQGCAGLTAGAVASDVVETGYYLACSRYPSADYKPLMPSEIARIARSIDKYDPELKINDEKVKLIGSAILGAARAYPESARFFQDSFRKLFHGKIKELIPHPALHELILNICTEGDQELAQRLAAKHRRQLLSSTPSLGLGFPKRNLFLYGINGIIGHILDFKRYPRRYGRSIFGLVGGLSGAAGTCYVLMFGFPGAELVLERTLEDSLRLHHHSILMGTVGTGVTMVGMSVGRFILIKLHELQSYCRHGVTDAGLAKLSPKEIIKLQSMTPDVTISDEHTPMIWTPERVENTRKRMLKIMATDKDQFASHKTALLELLHGRVEKAFCHPISGPHLAHEATDGDPQLRIRLMEHFGFYHLAAVQRQAETVALLDRNRQLEAMLETQMERSRALLNKLERVQRYYRMSAAQNRVLQDRIRELSGEVRLHRARSLSRGSSSELDAASVSDNPICAVPSVVGPHGEAKPTSSPPTSRRQELTISTRREREARRRSSSRAHRTRLRPTSYVIFLSRMSPSGFRVTHGADSQARAVAIEMPTLSAQLFRSSRTHHDDDVESGIGAGAGAGAGVEKVKARGQ